MSASYEHAIDVVLQNMPECEDHELTRDEAKDVVDGLRSAGILNLEPSKPIENERCLHRTNFKPSMDAPAWICLLCGHEWPTADDPLGIGGALAHVVIPPGQRGDA